MPNWFLRNIQVVECIDTMLSPLQTVYLRLKDLEANVATIVDRIQEQLDSEELMGHIWLEQIAEVQLPVVTIACLAD